MDSSEYDNRIISRVKAGETNAFKELIDKYKDDAYALACSILKDRQRSEDVLQDVFMQVFIKLKSFRQESTFYTWLYRIVVNRCYNELRKKKVILDYTPETSSLIEDPMNIADTNNVKDIVNFSLDRMKPDEALVLRLFYLSELNIKEVVEVTDFSDSKVKVTLHRARKNLALILKNRLGKEIEEL